MGYSFVSPPCQPGAARIFGLRGSIRQNLAATRLVHSSARGDLDGNGVVTSADIMVFIEALGGGHDGTELPIRADLELDAADLMIVLESLDG